MLQELACRHPPVELLLGEEVVLPSLLLARALGPGSGGDGDLEVVPSGEQRADQRALAGPGRARDDEQLRRSGQDAPTGSPASISA
jgi:hypothetical protein